MKRRLLGLSLAGIISSLASQALASGFQLFEANGVGAGDVGAGGAAIAEDASTAYFNPAGLTRLKGQNLVASVNGIDSRTEFNGTTYWAGVDQGAGLAKGGGFHLIPALHYAAPINSNLVFGFSVAAPFGLETDYPVTGVQRYAATHTAISVIDLSPSLGFKVNEQFSLGLGIDIQRVSATFNSVAGIPVANPSVRYSGSRRWDSTVENEANGWGYGWHAGLMYQFTPATRVGLAYRSQTSYHATGTSKISGPLANPLAFILSGGTVIPPPNQSNGLTADVTLPAITTLSIYHDVNDRLAVMASVNYTQWSVFDNLRLVNTAGVNAGLVPIQNGVANVPQNFRNTWRTAIGANYRLNERWLVRGGVGYDQTPTNDTDRGIRLPDGDRYMVGIGARFQATKALAVDLGWTHLFIKDGPNNNTQLVGSTPIRTMGISKSSADVIGAQVTWSIG